MNFPKPIQRKGAKTQRRKDALCRLSLAPGFSPVFKDETSQSRFNGLAGLPASRGSAKTVETVYVFSVGSTGDPPVPSGDPPDGMGSGIERKGNGFLAAAHLPFRPAGRRAGRAGRPHHPT